MVIKNGWKEEETRSERHPGKDKRMSAVVAGRGRKTEDDSNYLRIITIT